MSKNSARCAVHDAMSYFFIPIKFACEKNGDTYFRNVPRKRREKS